MNQVKGKTIHKILLIAFICLAVILTVAGVILVNITPSTGSEKTIEQQNCLVSEVRNTSSLSDDAFIFGINNIIPIDATDKSVINNAIQELRNELESALQMGVYTEYLSSMGEPAAFVVLPDTCNLTEVLTVFQHASIFTKIYIMMADINTDIVSSEFLFSEGVLHELYQSHSIETVVMPDKISSMCSILMYEYNLTAESFCYSGSELCIDVSDMSYDDALCIFDYSWQYLLQEEIVLDLELFSSEMLLASARTEKSSAYIKYYPSSDLAPLYRLTYYYQNNFLKNDLRVTCQRYLK